MLYGYIDHTGKYVIEPRFIFAEPFSCQRAVVQIREPGKLDRRGFIDKTGSRVFFAYGALEGTDSGLESFKNGLASFKYETPCFPPVAMNKHFGYLDTEGKIIWSDESGFKRTASARFMKEAAGWSVISGVAAVAAPAAVMSDMTHKKQKKQP
jgi:hypothetical protein